MPSKVAQSAFRLTKEAKKHLKRLAKQRGISMTAVVETLIRDEASRAQWGWYKDGEPVSEIILDSKGNLMQPRSGRL